MRSISQSDHVEGEMPCVEMGDAPSGVEDNHKQGKAMWWCCFGGRPEGSSSVHRTAMASFQRMRQYTNHWQGEANNSDACRLHKGLKNSVRRTREWCKDAVGSSPLKWKRLFAKLKSNIDAIRSPSFHSKPPRFKYDALSYSLNFDEGMSRFEWESYPAFSARFAAPNPNPLDKEASI